MTPAENTPETKPEPLTNAAKRFNHKTIAAYTAAALIAAAGVTAGFLGGNYYAQFTDSSMAPNNIVTGGTLSLDLDGTVAYIVDKCDPTNPITELSNTNNTYQIGPKATRLWMKIPLDLSLPTGWKTSKLAVSGNNIATITSPGSTLASQYPNLFKTSDAFLMDEQGNRSTTINHEGKYSLFIPSGVDVETYAGHSWPEGSRININRNNIFVELKQQP